MLQSNIEAVTGHIRKKLEEKGEADVERKVLHFIPTAEGKTYWYDGENYWRIMTFIPRAKTYETVNPEYSYYAGTAFGNFQAMLADIPDTLGETIPDFHNMEFRLKQLRDAVAADAAGRVQEVRYFLDEIENALMKCVRQNVCTVKANCPNGYATVIRSKQHDVRRRRYGALCHRPGYGDAQLHLLRLWRFPSLRCQHGVGRRQESG